MGAFRAIRRDPWLRWASMLLVEAERLWRNPRRPDTGLLAHSVRGLLAPDVDLAARVARGESIDTRLEVLGPIRLLRAVASVQAGTRVSFQHRRVAVEVDLAEGLVVGARALLPGEGNTPVTGPVALASLLGLASARVRIRPAAAPRSADIMAPLDDAIRVAAGEKPLSGLLSR